MTEHILKMDSDVFFQSISPCLRPFEVRWNDRDFKKGDILICRETVYTGEEMKKGMPLKYTGRTIRRKVLYVEHGPLYGLKEGWVIMGVENV